MELCSYCSAIPFEDLLAENEDALPHQPDLECVGRKPILQATVVCQSVMFEIVRHWRAGDSGPLGESVYGEQLDGAEKISTPRQQRIGALSAHRGGHG
jgi:hypothetical protein